MNSPDLLEVRGFSGSRLHAVIIKEVMQIFRDPATLIMAIGLPLLQILIFGYAINTNPHNMPAALVTADHSQITRDVVTSLANTGYFDITPYDDEKKANQALARGDVLFVLNIPPDFARQVLRGEKPDLLMDADATDSVTISAATAALPSIAGTAVTRDLPVTMRLTNTTPFSILLHARYNPEQLTAITIVPGLIGLILTFSTMVLTTLSITRERETGTMETLLVLPLLPSEVMMGKIVPYIMLGLTQLAVILISATLIFHVPIAGSLALLVLATLLFIFCNLALGFALSTMARTQMQAQQMAMFALLPAVLLSGFAFPFSGMPLAAKIVGEILPLTHMVRLCRGIMLKGLGLTDLLPDLLFLAAFAFITGQIALRFYRTTLD